MVTIKESKPLGTFRRGPGMVKSIGNKILVEEQRLVDPGTTYFQLD